MVNACMTGKHFVRTLDRDLFFIVDDGLACLIRVRSKE